MLNIPAKNQITSNKSPDNNELKVHKRLNLRQFEEITPFNTYFQEEKPWPGYWGFSSNHIPSTSTINHPLQYNQTENLSISIPTHSKSGIEYSSFSDAWCKQLPHLSTVRTLWVQTSLSQDLFFSICKMPHLEKLYIQSSSLRSISAIVSLKHLTHLFLGHSPNIENLDSLYFLNSLRWLHLQSVPAATNLSFLEHLSRLKGLEIFGCPQNSDQYQLSSLFSLSNLFHLEWLTLEDVSLSRKELPALYSLKGLKYLYLPNKFSLKEVALLEYHLPKVRCELFRPISNPISEQSCTQCKRHSLVRLNGRGMPLLCLNCHPELIAKHKKLYETILTKINRLIANKPKD